MNQALVEQRGPLEARMMGRLVAAALVAAGRQGVWLDCTRQGSSPAMLGTVET